MTYMLIVAFSGLFCNHAVQNVGNGISDFQIFQQTQSLQSFCGVPRHSLFNMYVDQTLCLFPASDFFVLFCFNEAGKPRNYIPFEASASHLRERTYLLHLILTCSVGVRRQRGGKRK